MTDRQSFHNHSCALFMVDGQDSELENSRVMTGTLIVDSDEIYFEKDDTEGFPLPRGWSDKILSTPRDRIDLFMGCPFYICVEREEAKDILKVFNIEERWDCLNPAE